MPTYTLAGNINIRGYRGQEWAFDPCGIWLPLLTDICAFAISLVILSTSAEIMEWKGLKGKRKSLRGEKCGSGQNISQQTSLP